MKRLKWLGPLVVVLAMVFSLGAGTNVISIHAEEPTEETSQETTPEETTTDEMDGTQTDEETSDGTSEETQSEDNGISPLSDEGAAPLAEGYAAQIGDHTYATIDEAVEAAVDGDTIIILQNAASDGWTISNKDLRFTTNSDSAGNTITFNKLGIYASDSNLQFDGVNVVMNVSDQSSGSGATANLLDDTNLTLNNASFTVTNDHADAGGESGIYMYQGSNIYLYNGSSLNISGFNDSAESSGLYCDSSEYEGMPNRQLVVDGGSSVNIHSCGWHGMTVNPLDITVSDASSINVTGSGNSGYGGGIGCYYGKMTVTGGSAVNANNNIGDAWGIFIKDLEVDATSVINTNNNNGDGLAIGGIGNIKGTINSCSNKRNGIWVDYQAPYWNGDVTIDTGATVIVDENAVDGIFNQGTLTIKSGESISADNNDWYGIRSYSKMTIESGAVVTMNSNGLSGLSNASDSGIATSSAPVLTIGSGADIEIMYNRDGGIYNTGNLDMQSGVVMYNTSEWGGSGIYNQGTAVLGSDVVMYNNHGNGRADDIYNGPDATITFSEITGSNNWYLDGEYDSVRADQCKDLINGWYDDSLESRWEAHAANVNDNHIVEFDPSGSYTGTLSLKAAHDLKTYTITIYYIEEETNVRIKDTVTITDVPRGSAYDVTEYDKVDINGFTYTRTVGDLTGNIESDIEITVYYKRNPEQPKEDKTETTKTDGNNTGVTLSLAGVFGTMSVALGGMITLISRKRK